MNRNGAQCGRCRSAFPGTRLRVELARILLALVTGVPAHAVFAQGAGQFERQFSPPPALPTEQGPTIPESAEQKPPPDADKVRFVLKRIDFGGDKSYTGIYPEAELKPLYAAYLDKEMNLAELYGVAEQLTAKYRNDGYVLTRVIVPPQSIRGGVVQLQVVEGYIAETRIQGGSAGPRSTLEKHLERIRESRPLNAGVLERELLLVNDLPGLSASAAIGPSATPSAADLSVELNERRTSLSAGINNRGSKSLGPWRADFSAGVNQLLWGYDRLSARVIQTFFDNELTFASLGYDRVLGASGARAGISGSYVDSKPGGTQNFDLPTNSRSGTAYISYPWVRSRATNLSSRLSFSYLDSKTDQTFAGGQTFRLSEDNIRALRVGMTYDRVDRFRGVSVIDLELSRGLEIMGSSRKDDPTLSVAGGRPDFTKLTLYAARLQSIVPKWSVLGAINAQHGASTLLSPERFTFGGEQFGRAYDAAELTGDSGAAFKAELRYTDSTTALLRDYTLYGFYEIGTVHRRGASVQTTGQRENESAANVGLGMRFSLRKLLTGYVEVAQPLTKRVDQEGDKNPRFFVGLQISM